MFLNCHLIGMQATVLFLGQAATPPTVEEVEKKLIELREKVTSFVARVSTIQKHEVKGNITESDSTGTIDWMRKGDKVVYRSKTSGHTSFTRYGQSTVVEATSTSLCDGEFLYQIYEDEVPLRAIKRKNDLSLSADGGLMFQRMRQDHSLTMLADEPVDGVDCYVVEATPNKPNEAAAAKTLMYFQKETGINVKNVGLAKDGTSKVFTHSYFDIKVNAAVDPEQFTFKPPPDAVIVDKTAD